MTRSELENIIAETPNDQQLGEILRQWYWETYEKKDED